MMTTTTYSERTIGEIVALDFRAAGIFKKAGIDFCCGGKKSLEKACEENAIDSAPLVAELMELESKPAGHTKNFLDWDLGFLCDYIVNTHHLYVLKTLPELVFYTRKIAQVHGAHHPELLEVAELFGKINAELLQHLQHEEEVLFPAIKKALRNPTQEVMNLIISEIDRMSGEHEFAGGAMDRINAITMHYRVPEDGCNTYHVTFQMLEQFEDDLHIHVHLENNILYSRALAISNTPVAG
jgi:regulator of cell morphogenesis and NO signaling